MIRTSFARLVEISALLGVDEDKRKQWGDVLTKLPGWPVMGEKDKSVFGVAFNGDNKPIIAPLHNDSYARDCHPIFPSGALGLKEMRDSGSRTMAHLEPSNRWRRPPPASGWARTPRRICFRPSAASSIFPTASSTTSITCS